jgi:4-alpha-glucanotransferase
MLRLDHVMGLHRLFWIPPGLPASEGAFVDYRADELYAILSLESHRHRTTLVGENLGTVPPEVNQAMTRHGLREMYVVQYECAGQSAGRLRSPPPKAVASLNTHDMPPFASYWTGLDLADHAALGLIPKARLSAARRSRREMNEALAKFLFRAGWLKTTQPDAACLVRACLEWLASGRAETVLLNLEDLWQETRCQNLPGTSVERPNWRRKSRCSLEELRASPPLRDLLRRINRLRKKRSEFSRA